MGRSVMPCVFVSTLALAEAYVAPKGAMPCEVPVRVFPRTAEQPRVGEACLPKATQGVSWNPLILGMVLGLLASGVINQAPAFADADAGSAVFAANCASCHAGGNNLVAPDKKLNKESLQKYGKYEVPALVSQVAKGNGSMPAFGSKLSPEDVQDVADYVRAQADKGW